MKGGLALAAYLQAHGDKHDGQEDGRTVDPLENGELIMDAP